MTVVARRVASIPQRLATDTWFRIVDLLAPTNGDSRKELISVTGISSSLITREAMTESPIVVSGHGPRIRLYCIYGEKAIEGVNVNEAAISDSPAESDNWTLSLPCPADDLDWVQAGLEAKSGRITARDMLEKSPDESEDESAKVLASIDRESFLRK